jgi:hypothetical protein
MKHIDLLKPLTLAYAELLAEAMYLYQYYPSNFRAKPGKYFKEEIEVLENIEKIVEKLERQMKGCGETFRYWGNDVFICGKDYGRPFGIMYCEKCEKKVEK